MLYELNRIAEAEGLIRDGLSLSQKFGAPYSEVMCRLLLRQAQLAQKNTADAVDPLATDEAIDALLLELTSQHSRPPAVDEFEAAYKKEGAAMTRRENVHRMADANKAFAHFAW